MTAHSEQPAQLSPLKQAYLALEKMQAKLEAIERAKREPIAIIGIGCRLPGGANTPEAFWELLCNGVDAVKEIPADRWDIEAYYDPDPNAPGKMSTRWGAFLEQVDQFEPQFFGISPREATSMDPQQRLVLETSWEALERAGQAPDKLSGSRTGVFVGIVNVDYRQLQLEAYGITHIDTYYGSGNAPSILSGRVSYVLGLQGPSVSVDTACSSSLVAVHLACQSLLSGECRMALAGGVNLVLIPELTVALSKFQMMAPDGRCKAFDARADGFVRGEGCGMVVLKRLSDAVADGDPILAVIRGTAANQDGASSGLTAPNGPSQEAVVRDALAKAGVKPAEVSYIETHGTGTSLGDPIEVQALGAVLGEGRPQGRPLMIGSVKTNVGHQEAAAGITGLIKAVLTLQHRQVPPHLHLQELNPFIPWAELPIVIPTELTPWPAEAPLIAGVSSFGFSGTNAHVVLAAAPETQPAAIPMDRPLHLLSLSAKSEKALQELAGHFADYLSNQPETSPADASFTANTGRAQLTQRLAVLAGSTTQMAEKLAAFATGQAPADTFSGPVKTMDRPKIAFLFTGQGSQYVQMGRQLYDTQPTFRQTIDKCDELLRPYLNFPPLRGDRGGSLLSVLYPEAEDSPLLDETAYTQPALFALEYALAELWRSWGIEPTVVMGHSVGEYVAACVAGVFSLEDGLKLIAERGRLMQALPEGGVMAAIFAPEARVAAALEPYKAQVAIAAVNGPENIVISGVGEVVQTILNGFAEEGIKSRRLTVSHAFHSPLMEPMLDAFEKVAASVTYAAPRIKLVSNVTGQLAMGTTVTQPGYWRRHVREAVQFARAMETLQAQGVELFLEVGPNPTLLGMGQRCLPEGNGTWLPSLRSGRNDWQQMLQSLGALYVYGAEVNWAGFDRDYAAGRSRLVLPTYPFQRKRYWIEKKGSRPQAGQGPMLHPLLGRRLRSALKEVQFEAQLVATSVPYLDDHRLHGLAIMPGTAYIEIALAAANQLFGPAYQGLEELVIQEAFIINGEEERTLQVVVTPEAGQSATVQIFSSGAAESAWQLHAVARVRGGQAVAPVTSPVSLERIQKNCSEIISAEAHYQTLRERGLQFGPSLHGVEQIRRCPEGGEALGQIRLPEFLKPEAKGYQLHPALLDACLQVLASAMPNDQAQTDIYMPVSLDALRLYRRPDTQLWSHAQIQLDEPATGPVREILTGNLQLLAEDGQLVAEISGLRLKRATQEALLRVAQSDLQNWLYQVIWEPQPLSSKFGVPGSELTFNSPQNLPGELSTLNTELRTLNSELGTLAEIAGQVRPMLAGFNEQHGLEAYRALGVQIDRLSADYVMYAFQKLGWRPQPGERFTSEALAEKLAIRELYHRLLSRMLEMLTEDGILRQIGPETTASPHSGGAEGGWELIQLPAPTSLETLQARWNELLAGYPAFEAEVTFIGRCGPHLAEVLNGSADPLQYLFPGGSLVTAEKLYTTSPFARAYNSLVKGGVKTIVAQLPAGRKLRILEIGAGTGGTTSHVLPELPADRAEYIFTDVSPLFTAKAAQKFQAYNFVHYQPLDIEQESVAQGFEAHQYDLILATNVIHATTNLRRTFTHIRRLLAPGGLLLMLEMTRPERWVDLTFGLTEGWWKFDDLDVRTAGPLLHQGQWVRLMESAGFATVAAIPELAEGDLPQQAVLLAQNSLDTTSPLEGGTEGGRENWLIFTDENGVGEKLASLIQAQRGRCVLVSPDTAYASDGPDRFKLNPAKADDFKRLLVEGLAGDQAGWHGVVHLWSLNCPAPAAEGTALSEAQEFASGSALYLVQALAGSQGTPPRLWLVTQGAQPVGEQSSPIHVEQSPLWGLGKVVALEHPELRCVRIDLDPAPAVENSQLLWAELQAAAEEDQVGFRDQNRYVARLERYQADKSQLATTLETEVHPEQSRREAQSVQLQISSRGTLENLILQPAGRRQPGPGEVEIRVRATGLNFKDVLNTLGMYPGDPGPLGGECAGEIVAVGPGVEGLRPGDPVMALAGGSFATFVITNAQLVVRKPAGLSFEEAATIPIPFLTAYYTLHHLGKMSAGERVLIHAAAGGVGLAAVQLARRAGAEVFGTAGSPEKQSFLKSMGVQHVMSSRTLDFAPEIMKLTGGQGVNLVLNSLADDFVTQSVATLAEGGRFLEIGKRGILSEQEMAQRRPDARYFIVDWTEACVKEPALIRGMFLEIMAAIEDGSLQPLPRQVFALAEVVDAFRYMAQAKHIGKIVVSQPTPPPVAGGMRGVRPDATYLITGGLSGLGLLVARWLLDKGARHLVLMGRRGASETAQETIREMEQAGAQIVVAQADVSLREQVSRVVAEIETNMPPLRGIIHSAGLLDDGVILHQTWSRFAKVMAPKVEGSWHLHTLTRHLPLDFFVMFSSVASLLGSPGQSNHAAANTFEDILAAYRRAQGLPALSINWGAWSEVGAAVEHNVFDRITVQGVGTISPEQGLQLLEQLMAQAPAQVGVTPITWPVFSRQFAANQVPAFFTKVLAQEKSQQMMVEQSAQQFNFLDQLAEAPLNKRLPLLLGYVQEQTGKVLGLEAQSVGEQIPLNGLGLDSLMAVELRNLLGSGLNLKRSLPATLVFDYPTVEAITGYLARELSLETNGHGDHPESQEQLEAQPEADGQGLLNSLATLEELSDEEVDRLFAQQMQHMENWNHHDDE